MFSIRRVISEDEVERRYRHVHHADSLKVMEEARTALLAHLTFPMEWFFERNLFPVVTQVSVRYLREITLGSYTVTCTNPRREEKAFFVDQEIVNERGKSCVRATVEWKVMDGATKRAVLPPEEFLKAYASQRE